MQVYGTGSPVRRLMNDHVRGVVASVTDATACSGTRVVIETSSLVRDGLKIGEFALAGGTGRVLTHPACRVSGPSLPHSFPAAAESSNALSSALNWGNSTVSGL
jgi:hypothetical protein